MKTVTSQRALLCVSFLCRLHTVTCSKTPPTSHATQQTLEIDLDPSSISRTHAPTNASDADPTTIAPDDVTVRDVVDNFLSIVAQYDRNKKRCKPGTTFNLGGGVVAQYGVVRFRAQAMAAVNRARFLTRIWKSNSEELLGSERFLYAAVRWANERLNPLTGEPVIKTWKLNVK